jgi:hypothetical protein
MEILHPMNVCSKYVTVSIGLASAIPDDSNSQTQLLDEADKALYMAKQSGRNRVAVSNYFGKGYPSKSFDKQKIPVNNSTGKIPVGLYKF